MEEIAPPRRPYIVLLIVLAVLGCVFRFFDLENVPPGVFVDEQGAMANAMCLLRDGTSIYHKPWPLFFPGLGGFYDPIFIYSEAVFAKIFGPSIATFRIFPSLCLLAACFGTAALAWTFLGIQGACLALVTALFCPWSFHAGRLVWGSGVFTAFITWGLFFLWRAKFCGREGKVPYLWAILSGVFFAAAMSLYRPANAVVLLLLVLLFALRTPSVAIRFRYLFASLASTIVCGIPNLLYIAGSGWGRIDALSIFGKEHMSKLGGSYISALGEFLENYGKLLSWDFLFVSGDAIYRHTPGRGALGWPEACGLFVLGFVVLYGLYPFRKRKVFGQGELGFLIFCVGAVLIGLFPAAQSWDSNPHALRANAAWPFFVLLATIGLTKLYRLVAVGPMIMSLVYLIYVPVFLSYYFLVFPEPAASWFDVGLVNGAKYAQTSGDWSKFAAVVKDYGRDGPSVFPMMYNGMNCATAIEFVENLRPGAAGKVRTSRADVTTHFLEPAPPAPGGSSNWPWPSP